jgi:peptidoglycan hydrolase-like protein with peptidoglycan-binding domain
VYEYGRGSAKNFALEGASVIATCIGVALVIAFSLPAEAKNKPKSPVSTEVIIPDPANGEPMTLIVSLRDQTLDVYRGTLLIASSKVSTGMPGYATKAGVFSILEKRRHHHSNMYSAAPMPWMQRLTWSGTALHGGVVPGYPASHGCIRLPFSVAPKLFQITGIGDNVMVAANRITPKLIEHPALFQPLPTPTASAAITEEARQLSLNDMVTTKASANEAPHAIASAIEAGAKAVGLTIAEPRSTAPLRILVTRRTQRDRIIDVQYALSALGYLKPQNFDGTLGALTITAIKAFQKEQGMRETGAFTEDVVSKVYQVADKAEPPDGRIFVRQDFRRVFAAPISFKDKKRPLGTHVFTAMKFAPGDTKTRWMTMTLEGDDAGVALDRIQIPQDIREKISERLTPGSSLITADESINSAILPEGADYLVSIKETPVVAEKPKAKQSANIKQARAKKAKPSLAKQAKAKNPTPAKVAAARKIRRPAPYYYDLPPEFRGRRFLRWHSPYGLR